MTVEAAQRNSFHFMNHFDTNYLLHVLYTTCCCKMIAMMPIFGMSKKSSYHDVTVEPIRNIRLISLTNEMVKKGFIKHVDANDRNRAGI